MNKSVFQKLAEKGVMGARKMDYILQDTVSKKNIVDYMIFAYRWSHWEKTLTKEERELMYQLMDEEIEIISKEILDRPKDSRDMVRDCTQLYKKLNKREEK